MLVTLRYTLGITFQIPRNTVISGNPLVSKVPDIPAFTVYTSQASNCPSVSPIPRKPCIIQKVINKQTNKQTKKVLLEKTVTLKLQTSKYLKIRMRHKKLALKIMLEENP